MSCQDFQRLLDYERYKNTGSGRQIFSMAFDPTKLEPLPANDAGLRQCAHPLHVEWCPSVSEPLALDAGVAICQVCQKCNLAMNSRNNQRIKLQSARELKTRTEIELKDKSEREGKRKAERELASRWAPVVVAQPAVGRLKPKRIRSTTNFWRGDYPQGDPGELAGAKSIKPEEDGVKARNCKGCHIEYLFFPDHHAFNDLPDQFVCNNCVDNVVCFACNVTDLDRDHEMILCEDCLLRGAHFGCIGLSGIPEGDWFCVDCVWKNEPELVGEPWLCHKCQAVNCCRWPVLGRKCLSCHTDNADGAVWKFEPSPQADPFVEWSRPPERDAVLLWGWTDIADFCFILQYGSSSSNEAAAQLDREQYIAVLRQLKGNAQDWLTLADFRRPVVPATLAVEQVAYFHSIVDAAVFMAEYCDSQVTEPAPLPPALPYYSSKRSKSKSTAKTPASWRRDEARAQLHRNKKAAKTSRRSASNDDDVYQGDMWQSTQFESPLNMISPPQLVQQKPLILQNQLQQQLQHSLQLNGGGPAPPSMILSAAHRSVTNWRSLYGDATLTDMGVLEESDDELDAQEEMDSDLANGNHHGDFQPPSDEAILKAQHLKKRLRLERTPGTFLQPSICAREHSLLPNVTYEKFAGKIVWVKLGDSPWALGQTYLFRDVPPEFVAEVSRLRNNVPEGKRAQLVLFFTTPSRNFGWALANEGEIAEFNVDWLESCLNYAASTNDPEMFRALILAQQTILKGSVESLVPDTNWVDETIMNQGPYDLGRLVFARLTMGEPFWPATVSCEAEVPPELWSQLLATVSESKLNPEDSDFVLVCFFDVPVNRYGWIKKRDDFLRSFRPFFSELLPTIQQRNRLQSRGIKACVRRALMFESCYVPSITGEGRRWNCMGCELLNHPFHAACFLCDLVKDESPLVYDFLEVCPLGARVFQNVTATWSSLSVSFASPFMPMGVIDFLYREIGLVVFALTSPNPFIGFYLKSPQLAKRSPEEWVVCLMGNDESPWTFINQLKSQMRALPAWRHVLTLDVDHTCDSEEVFGHIRFFEDPLSVVAGTFNKVYAKGE